MRGFLSLKQLFMTFSFSDLVDILVISVIIYYLIKLVKETRAEQLVKGILALLLMTALSDLLHLYTVNWLLTQIVSAGMIFVVIIFQPEIRRAFERLGRTQGSFFSLRSNDQTSDGDQAIEEIVQACSSLSRQKIGALIVLEGGTGLKDILESGTTVDALVSAELLIQIFIPNTPLHDGAVVIRDNRVRSASVFLPLTQNKSLSRELGTRHRAALGISEVSDALVVVVSEETGLISYCRNGKIARRLDEDILRTVLTDFYQDKENQNIFVRLLQKESDRTEEKEEKDKKPTNVDQEKALQEKDPREEEDHGNTQK